MDSGGLAGPLFFKSNGAVLVVFIPSFLVMVFVVIIVTLVVVLFLF